MAELHNTGEEWILRQSFGSDTGTTEVEVGLYNTSDGLLDNSNLDAITTEPEGNEYERQAAALGSGFEFTKDDGNWETIIDDLNFDVSDSSKEVNAYFVVASFESVEAGDTDPSDNLIFTGDLDKDYDLNIITTFTNTNSGLTID